MSTSAATKMTRRSALVGAALSSTVFAFGKSRATAFGLIGDRYHNSDYARIALNQNIRRDLGVSLDLTDETESLTADALDGRKLLIVLRDGMIWPDGYPNETTNAAWVNTDRPELISEPAVEIGDPKPQFWMRPEQGVAVREFVREGGSALFLHNTTHVGLTDPNFRHVLGAAYTGHPPIRTFKVKITNSDHPITHGVNDFVVTDEQHYMEYDKDPEYIFMETVNEEGLDYRGQGAIMPGGWAYDYGKGRVCYMSPGHLLVVLRNPEYIKLQHNAVNWLLRRR